MAHACAGALALTRGWGAQGSARLGGFTQVRMQPFSAPQALEGIMPDDNSPLLVHALARLLP